MNNELLRDANGKGYEYGKVYAFSDANGVKVFRTLQDVAGGGRKPFFDQAGKPWANCQEIDAERGIVHAPEILLIDGKHYMIEVNSEVVAARYHKGSNEFKVAGGSGYTALLYEVIK